MLHKNANINCAKESQKNLRFEKLYLEDKICYQLLLLDRVQLLYVKDSQQVTEFVITKGQANGTLPNYIYLGNTICLNCYNGIVTKSSAIFQQHAQTNTKQPETDEIEAIENTDESTPIYLLLSVRSSKQVC